MARKINFDAPVTEPAEERTRSPRNARALFSDLNALSSNPAHSVRYRTRLAASRRG